MSQSGVESPVLVDESRQAVPWRSLVGAAVLLAVFVFVFWDFISTQVLWALRHEADWGHTLVMPFVAGYFVYHERQRLLARPFRTAWVGLLPIALGLGWYTLVSLNDALRNHNLQGLGVWLALVGIALLFCGWRAMRVLWFPLVFVLIFGQSISDRVMNIVTYRMQDIAAQGAYVVLVLLGFDVDLAGNTLYLFDDGGQASPLNIAQACSGMRMLMAFLALGVIMAFLCLERPWQRVLLVLFAVPTAIVVNVLRVVTLALLAMVDTGFAGGNFHSFVGWVWLVPALFIYFGLVWVIRRLVVPAPDSMRPAAVADAAERPRTRLERLFDGRAPVALCLATVTLLAGGVGFRATVERLNVVLRKEPVPLRRHLAQIPHTLGPWQSEHEQVLDAASILELGTDQYLNRVYVHRGDEHAGSALAVHVAYYTGMVDAVPHIPDRCFHAGGFAQTSTPWNFDLPVEFPDAHVDDAGPTHDGEPYRILSVEHPVTGADEIVRLPFGDVQLRVSRFTRDEQDIYGGYLFVTNHRLTANPAEIRALAFRLSEPQAYFAKVQFTMQADPDEDSERFLALSSDLFGHLLPQLMRCLPDWSELDEPSPGSRTD